MHSWSQIQTQTCSEPLIGTARLLLVCTDINELVSVENDDETITSTKMVNMQTNSHHSTKKLKRIMRQPVHFPLRDLLVYQGY